MIELKDLQACAVAQNMPLAWYCYTLVEPKAWPLGYIFWKHARCPSCRRPVTPKPTKGNGL